MSECEAVEKAELYWIGTVVCVSGGRRLNRDSNSAERMRTSRHGNSAAVEGITANGRNLKYVTNYGIWAYRQDVLCLGICFVNRKLLWVRYLEKAVAMEYIDWIHRWNQTIKIDKIYIYGQINIFVLYLIHPVCRFNVAVRVAIFQFLQAWQDAG